MNDYPEYVEANGHTYKINTDFRVVIECNKIAEDENINAIERPLAILCMLFGPEALDHKEDLEELFELAQLYICCGQKPKKSNKKPDMDFVKDMPYIEASFMSDYNIDLENVEMHWWKFYTLLNGLSNSEMGNCCILNRIRNFRNFDPKEIKDTKKRNEIIEQQKEIMLDTKKHSKEKEKEVNDILKKLGIERK